MGLSLIACRDPESKRPSRISRAAGVRSHQIQFRSCDAVWRGIGPIQAASVGGAFESAEVSSRRWPTNWAGRVALSYRFQCVDGDDPTVVALKSDIKGLRGGLAFVKVPG